MEVGDISGRNVQTSIHFIDNQFKFFGKNHRDRNNSGLSLITSIGNYTGGNLLYWEDDDHKMSLDEVAKHEPQIVDLKDQAFLMNGQCAHAVEAFEGTRYSIVLYSCSKYPKLSNENKKYLNAKRICMA